MSQFCAFSLVTVFSTFCYVSSPQPHFVVVSPQVRERRKHHYHSPGTLVIVTTPSSWRVSFFDRQCDAREQIKHMFHSRTCHIVRSTVINQRLRARLEQLKICETCNFSVERIMSAKGLEGEVGGPRRSKCAVEGATHKVSRRSWWRWWQARDVTVRARQ